MKFVRTTSVMPFFFVLVINKSIVIILFVCLVETFLGVKGVLLCGTFWISNLIFRLRLGFYILAFLSKK